MRRLEPESLAAALDILGGISNGAVWKQVSFIGHYLLATVKAVGAYVMTSVRFTGCAFNRQRWIAQRVVSAAALGEIVSPYFVLPFQIVHHKIVKRQHSPSLLRPLFQAALAEPCTSLFVIDERVRFILSVVVHAFFKPAKGKRLFPRCPFCNCHYPILYHLHRNT